MKVWKIFIGVIVLVVIAFAVLNYFPSANASDQTLQTKIIIKYKDGSTQSINPTPRFPSISFLPQSLLYNGKAIDTIYLEPIVNFYYVGKISSVSFKYTLTIKIPPTPESEAPMDGWVAILQKSMTFSCPGSLINVIHNGTKYYQGQVQLKPIEITGVELEKAITDTYGQNFAGKVSLAFYVDVYATVSFTNAHTDKGSAEGYCVLFLTRKDPGHLENMSVQLKWTIDKVETGGNGGFTPPGGGHMLTFSAFGGD